MSRVALLAGATAAAVMFSGVVVPHATANESPVPPVAEGTVNWPIKDSFLRYIQGFAEGEIHTGDGVTAVKGASRIENFEFPVDAENSQIDAQGNGVIDLDGWLQFYGHKGLAEDGGWGLDLKYDDLKVVITDGIKAQLTADYEVKGGLPGRDEPAGPTSMDDAVIVSFELTEPLVPSENKRFNLNGMEPVLEQGGADSLLAYELHDVMEDGLIDIALKYGELPPPVQPADPAGSSGSSDNGSGSSKPSPAVIITGAIAGVAVVMGLATLFAPQIMANIQSFLNRLPF